MSQNMCPSCGKPSLVTGALQSTGAVRFRPLETKFLTFRTADVAVHASMCSSCGALVLTGDVHKLDLLKNRPGRQEAARAAGGEASGRLPQRSMAATCFSLTEVMRV